MAEVTFTVDGKKQRTACAIVLCLITASGNFMYSQKPAAKVIQGFYTGRTYMALTTAQREIYASGLFDGFMAGNWMGAPEKNVRNLHDCIPSLDSGQFAALLDKYLKEHPERWNVSMTVIGIEALPQACKQSPA